MATAPALAMVAPLKPSATSSLPHTHLHGADPSTEAPREADESRHVKGAARRGGLPEGFSTLVEEIGFVLICSSGQLLFAIYLSTSYVNQLKYIDALALESSYAAWTIGSFLVANGVSVVLSGSLADLSDPKMMTIISLIWLTVWNIIGVFTIKPSLVVLFFIARAMMGLSVGTLCSCAMSMLGKVYKPGNRKNKVFATMGAMIPMGFAVGGIQGGALSAHLEWIYGSTAIVTGLCALVAWYCIPSNVVKQKSGRDEDLSLKDFDTLGAVTGMAGCGLLIFGLTQGNPTHWKPYTYALVIVAVICFVAFGFVEGRVRRPLIDNRLWKVPGFLPLMLAYFIGYGAFVGSFMYYAVRFFLTVQHHPPIIVALFLLPIGIGGTVAAWVVSRILHLLPGHYILFSSAIAFSLGPVFFLPQTDRTIYWALSMPGLFLSTFGPDLSFAAITVFITSNVPRSFQGAAGSLVITAQNLSCAIFAAIADTLGERISKDPSAGIDLTGLRAIWWFSFAACLFAAVIAGLLVRIPKSEEGDHVE